MAATKRIPTLTELQALLLERWKQSDQGLVFRGLDEGRKTILYCRWCGV